MVKRPNRSTAFVFVLSFILCGCARGVPITHEGITILRFGHLQARPQALVHGRVTFANTCASVADNAGEPVTAIWPPDTQFDTSAADLGIVVQGVRFSLGDPISMGGGEYTDEAYVESLVGEIPDDCRGNRYWLVTDLAIT